MLKVGDKVFCAYDILRGLGIVLALSKTGKTAKVQWPNPYNFKRFSKPHYYKFMSLLNENAQLIR